MSSADSTERGPRHDSWSSLNYSFSDSPPPSSGRADYSTASSSKSSCRLSQMHSVSIHEGDKSEESALPELTQVPWTEADIIAALRQGQLKPVCENVSVECLHRLSYLLQRPLVRIAREAQRLSGYLNKCSQTEIQAGCKIVLPRQLYQLCNSYGCKAVILYTLSKRITNSSKSSRCGLCLSVGKHFRWLVEARAAGYIHELAAVYLTAVMECLVEQTFSLSLTHEDLGTYKQTFCCFPPAVNPFHDGGILILWGTREFI